MDPYEAIDTTRIAIVGGAILGAALLAKLWLVRVIRRGSAQVKAQHAARSETEADESVED